MAVESKRMIRLVVYAVLVFSVMFAYYAYDTRGASNYMSAVFYPDITALQEIHIEYTENIGTKEIIILSTKQEFSEFSALINEAYKNNINPNGSRYRGNDIIKYIYPESVVEFMVGTEQNDQVHARIYSDITSGWHYGRYRMFGFLEFIDKIKKTHNHTP